MSTPRHARQQPKAATRARARTAARHARPQPAGVAGWKPAGVLGLILALYTVSTDSPLAEHGHAHATLSLQADGSLTTADGPKAERQGAQSEAPAPEPSPSAERRNATESPREAITPDEAARSGTRSPIPLPPPRPPATTPTPHPTVAGPAIGHVASGPPQASKPPAAATPTSAPASRTEPKPPATSKEHPQVGVGTPAPGPSASHSPTTAPTTPVTTPGGFPTAATTGPSGALTPSGSITVTTSGTVLQDLDVTGTISIAPGVSNVTIKNVRVRSSTSLYLIDDRGTNLTVQDSELIGTAVPAPSDAVNLNLGTLTLTRDDISGVRNGVNLGGPAVIQDCYFHGIVQNPSSHNEDIYIGSGGNVRIVHNTLLNGLAQTAAVFIKTDFGPISNVLVQNNLMAGGGYVIYGGSGGPNGSATDVVATGNVISRTFFANGGQFGVRTAWPSDAASRWSGNVWDDGSPA